MGVFEEVRTYPIRFLKSCGLFSCFLCMGLSMGIVGPTLLDFKVKTEASLQFAALIIPVRAGGYALGTFVSGMFYHKMDVHKLIIATMMIAAVVTLAIPFISDINVLLVAFAVVGLSLGLYSSGGNMWILDLWGKGNPPFLQAAHFMLGFGAFAAPLIARPFLRTEGIVVEDPGECHELPEPPLFTNVTTFSSLLTNDTAGQSSYSSAPPPPTPIDPNDINLTVPFAIIAVIEFMNGIFFIIMKIMFPANDLHPSRLQAVTAPELVVGDAQCVDDDESNVSRKLSLIGLSRGYNSLGASSTRSSSRRNYIFTSNDTSNDFFASNAPSNASDKHAVVKCTLSHQLEKRWSYTSNASASVSTSGEKKGAPQSAKRFDCKRNDAAIKSKALEKNEGIRDDSSSKSVKRWRLLVIILAVLFMHIYYGLEIIFGTMLTTFANKAPLHLETTEGATVTSIYWGTFAFWRLPTVFYVDYLGPIKTIFFNLIILVAGNILLVPWGDSYRWAIYTGSGLVGLGASPIFASMFGVLEGFFPVTPKIASCMITASMLGEFVFPSIISPFISCTPNVFLWVALFCSLSVVFLFFIITSICFYKLNGNQADTGAHSKKNQS